MCGGVINALADCRDFLTLATYNIKHKTLHYYVNVDAAFRKNYIQYATECYGCGSQIESRDLSQHLKIIHIYCCVEEKNIFEWS